jgi:hypothetical protein
MFSDLNHNLLGCIVSAIPTKLMQARLEPLRLDYLASRPAMATTHSKTLLTQTRLSNAVRKLQPFKPNAGNAYTRTKFLKKPNTQTNLGKIPD